MDTFRLTSSIKDFKSFNLWQSLLAEFVGIFFLVFIGFGTAYDNLSPVKLGLGFGLSGAVAIFCIGPISGGHINPAVSFGLLIARQISLVRFVLYSIIQVLGATISFGLLMIITNGKVLEKSILSVKSGQNETRFNGEIVEIIHRIDISFHKVLCEMVITFVLVFTVMRMCVEKCRTKTEKGLAPLIIGLSITIGVYSGMNISGGSMNPAASLGKYFNKRSKGVWTHIVGPLLGGLLAGLFQQLLFTSELSREHIKMFLFSKDFGKPGAKYVKTTKPEKTNVLLVDFEKNEKLDKEKLENEKLEDENQGNVTIDNEKFEIEKKSLEE